MRTTRQTNNLQLDYKRLGDNLEIQPAAARMRLVRLRKAVTNKEFEDAMLVQPGKCDPEIAALANPESRTLTAAASKARETRTAKNKRKELEELSPALVPSEDDDSEFSDEFEHEEEDEPPLRHASVDIAKRKATSVPPGDSQSDEEALLFFEDTSSTSRRAKKVKVEDEMRKDEKLEESDQNEPKLRAKKVAQNVVSRRSRKAEGQDQKSARPSTNKDEKVTLAAIPASTQVVGHREIPRTPPRSAAPSPQPWTDPFSARSAPGQQQSPAARPVSRHLTSSKLQMPTVPHGLHKIGGVPPQRNTAVWPAGFGQRRFQPTPPSSSSFSNPASVFFGFQPARPSPFAAANPATKHIIIPASQRAQLPVEKTEWVADDAPTKKTPVRPRELANPDTQARKIKLEDDAGEQIGSGGHISATRARAEFGVDVISREKWDAAGKAPEEEEEQEEEGSKDLDDLNFWQMPE